MHTIADPYCVAEIRPASAVHVKVDQRIESAKCMKRFVSSVYTYDRGSAHSCAPPDPFHIGARLLQADCQDRNQRLFLLEDLSLTGKLRGGAGKVLLSSGGVL